MTSLDERLRNKDYANWLQVTYGLKCVKDGLGAVTERIMAQFQEEIVKKNNVLNACNNESCNSQAIKRQGVDRFNCPNNVCSALAKSIAAEHINQKQLTWENCDVRQWPVKCWEIAKVYMSRGLSHANAGPASTDCTGLLHLVSKCKQFKSKVQINPGKPEKIINIRNSTMHSPNFSLDETYTADALSEMVSFLEVVQNGMKGTYDDINDCESAIAVIKELSEVKLTVEMESACLSEEMSDINARLSCTTSEESNSPSQIEVAQKQATLLTKIVHDDPDLTSRLSADLALLHDRVDSIADSVENVQHQVDSLETRVEQLELKPSAPVQNYKNALQNYIQGKGLKLPEYSPIPQPNGFLAKVTVCGEVFESSQVRTRKVDAEKDAAKLAFEHLQQQQQQQQNDGTSAASVACATADAVAGAGAAASDDVHSRAAISTYSPAVAAVSSPSNGTVTKCNNAEPPARTPGIIITKNTSYLSILEQLCAEMSLSPPTVEVSKRLAECTATLSVGYGFPSSGSHTKKTDAQEDAAHIALLTLADQVESGKNFRAQLNEYCQQQQCGKPEYVTNDSAPFTCTVFVQIVYKSLARSTELEAKDDAAREIVAKLGRTSHILQMCDDSRFESFSVSCKPPSVFELTARYHFARHSEGDKSKKTAEKMAAEDALWKLYPDLNPKPGRDHCKNKLQELYPQEPPKYNAESGDGGLFYSDVIVSFVEQNSYDDLSSLAAADDLAKRALKRLGLIS